MGVFVVMLLSLAACSLGGGNTNNGGGGTGDGGGSGDGSGLTIIGENLEPKSIKKLKDLTDYSKKATDYNAPVKTYDATGKKYDGKDCTAQIEKLQRRIDRKTKDVYLGKTDSAATKIFTKSTPDGILSAIAKAALTYDEMVRTVDYIAGDEDADVDSFVEELTDAEGKTTGWTGTLTTTSSKLKEWLDVKNSKGGDLNAGWSFFDDWDLYDRLKDYSKSSLNKLNKGNDNKLNDIGTQEVSEDNASWQYRSILEKIYKPAKQGGVDLPGATAARLVTHMLDYALTITDTMSNSSVADAFEAYNKSGAGDKNTTAYSQYFRRPAPIAPKKYEESEYDRAKTDWNPYSSLGDYDVLVYLMSFYEYYKVTGGGYNTLTGMQSCALLYGYYYQYNQTYYNVVLADRDTYKKQLRYEKLDTYTDTEWLDYVRIQRTNYEGSYRYGDKFYRTFYKVHFDFQESKEEYEKCVYVITDIVGRTYTEEMQKAIDSTQKGVEGQLAMSDWLWCYGASESNMKSYNTANTNYQKGKRDKDKDKEYEGRFWYEFEELKIVDYLFTKMTNDELSGALYYNCYAYSGSLISEIQNYEKDYVLITDGIKNWDKITTIPASAGIAGEDENNYAKGKIKVLQAQASSDWKNTNVDTKATDAKNQSWNKMATEIKDAQKWDYDSVVNTDTKKTLWQFKCECLEDRVVAKTWSCCGQRVSTAVASTCGPNHGVLNSDNTTEATKDYDPNCQISLFVSTYEDVLYYVATKAKVQFQKPSIQSDVAGKGGYVTTDKDESTKYTTGYYGNIEALRKSASALMSYGEMKEMVINLGKSFKEEVADGTKEDDGSTTYSDDGEWWRDNKNGSGSTDFGPYENDERTSGSTSTTTYVYSYAFSGWYLDVDCKYEFNPEDDIDFSINVYAGYELTKTKK